MKWLPLKKLLFAFVVLIFSPVSTAWTFEDVASHMPPPKGSIRIIDKQDVCDYPYAAGERDAPFTFYLKTRQDLRRVFLRDNLGEYIKAWARLHFGFPACARFNSGNAVRYIQVALGVVDSLDETDFNIDDKTITAMHSAVNSALQDFKVSASPDAFYDYDTGINRYKNCLTLQSYNTEECEIIRREFLEMYYIKLCRIKIYEITAEPRKNYKKAISDNLATLDIASSFTYDINLIIDDIYYHNLVEKRYFKLHAQAELRNFNRELARSVTCSDIYTTEARDRNKYTIPQIRNVQ